MRAAVIEAGTFTSSNGVHMPEVEHLDAEVPLTRIQVRQPRPAAVLGCQSTLPGASTKQEIVT